MKKKDDVPKFFAIGPGYPSLSDRVRFFISGLIQRIRPEKQYTQEELGEKVKESFAALEDFLVALDPVKLISRLTLQFRFYPQGEFHDVGTDIWPRWIEFLCDYFLKRSFPQKISEDINDETIKTLEKLMGAYFSAISNYVMNPPVDMQSEERARIKMKHNYLFVRGDAYQYQFLGMAKELYGPHDEWFRKNLGFTIADAVTLFEAISQECTKRVNEGAGTLTQKAKDAILGRKRLNSIANDAHKLLSFTLDELSFFSGVERAICEKFITRLSQYFGYENPEYQGTFRDAFSAPWDYSTMQERPLIALGDKYFSPIPDAFPSVLFYTFHYDLMRDSHYAEIYNEKRGKWLEQKTAECLRRVFPAEQVFLNPRTIDGKKELCDVIVLHDCKIYIVQCKAKKLRRDSRIGADIDALRKDAKQSITDAFDQAIKARDYLKSGPKAHIRVGRDQAAVIDMEQVNEVFLVIITLSVYPEASLASLNSMLHLFEGKEYPWLVPLFDFDIITEIIDRPSFFINFTKRRIDLERSDLRFQVPGDVDFLGFYLYKGLYFGKYLAKRFLMVGFEAPLTIDKYIIDKYGWGLNPEKPQRKMPPGFDDLIRDLESLDFSYVTDCISWLIDLDYIHQKQIIEAITKTRDATLNDHSIHSFSMHLDYDEIGFSFFAMDLKSDFEEVDKQTFMFAVAKKHQTKSPEWIGFGWDVSSKKLVDAAFFLSYPWREDESSDKLVKYLRKGTKAKHKH